MGGAGINQREWVSLFNGENLDGWTAKFAGHDVGVNYKNTFRAADGILSVNYDEYERFEGAFGHLFYHQPFSHYLLRFEYRMIGEQTPGAPAWAVRNNGVMLHSQAPDSMTRDQAFPRSVEAQLLNGDGKTERSNGNVCTPGTHIEMDGKLMTQHCISSNSATNYGDGWIAVELEVRGSNVIRHRINGALVLEYNRPQIDAKDKDTPSDPAMDGVLLHSGYIALQSESHPTDFRNIRLLNLAE